MSADVEWNFRHADKLRAFVIAHTLDADQALYLMLGTLVAMLKADVGLSWPDARKAIETALESIAQTQES